MEPEKSVRVQKKIYQDFRKLEKERYKVSRKVFEK